MIFFNDSVYEFHLVGGDSVEVDARIYNVVQEFNVIRVVPKVAEDRLKSFFDGLKRRYPEKLRRAGFYYPYARDEVLIDVSKITHVIRFKEKIPSFEEIMEKDTWTMMDVLYLYVFHLAKLVGGEQ